MKTNLGPSVDSYKVYTPVYSIIATWLKEDGVDENGGISNYQLVISTDEVITVALYIYQDLKPAHVSGEREAFSWHQHVWNTQEIMTNYPNFVSKSLLPGSNVENPGLYMLDISCNSENDLLSSYTKQMSQSVCQGRCKNGGTCHGNLFGSCNIEFQESFGARCDCDWEKFTVKKQKNTENIFI